MGCPPRKKLGIILKMDGGKTSTNWPENKKTQNKNERKRKVRQILGPCQVAEKVMEREGINLRVHLEQSLKAWKGDWRNLKLEEESITFRPQHCYGPLEYSEVYWRLKGTCCH